MHYLLSSFSMEKNKIFIIPYQNDDYEKMK